MTIKAFILASVLGGVLSISNNAVGQDRPLSGITYESNDSLQKSNDSLQKSAEREYIKVQKKNDADNISDLKVEREKTKMKAREAQRVERDANDAAVESRNAYRTEKKAQRSRKKADAQAKKALRARDKSNKN
jgi:hypothetical protein